MNVFHVLHRSLEQTGSRSDVLKPLAWLTAIEFAALAGLTLAKANNGFLIFVAVLLALSVMLYIASYAYCLVKNPDALRSERFAINKMAIERGVYGDSNVGVIDAQPASGGPVLAIGASGADEA